MASFAKLAVLVLVALGSAPAAHAQFTRSDAVPHYITVAKQIDPEAAAVYCAGVPTDAHARGDAEAINRLAREAFGSDVDVLSVPFRNADEFVAPPLRGAKRGRTATFEVEYSGFAPEAKTAFQYAVDIWSALIESPVTIRISASWTSLSSRVLGSAGPNQLHADFGFGELNTWYPSALADALAGEDLNPQSNDIVANFNSDFSSWYFGLDGNTPSGEIDFVTVVLHEIGHGLGFFGTMDVDDGSGSDDCDGVEDTGCWGFDQFPGIADIFGRFAEVDGGGLLIDTTLYPNPSLALGAALTSGGVYFDGPAAVDAYGVRPPLYAPSSWNGGSSFSHLDENSFAPGDPSSLMTPFVSASEAIHDPGTVGCGIFADIGWTTTADCASGIVPETPSIPVPLSPADGATDVSIPVTLSWGTALQADAYTIEIARTSSFASPELSVSGITETSYAVEGLDNGTQYYWHVRATNAQSTSQYSTAYGFTTADAPPAAPELTAPSDGAAALPTTLTLDWESVVNADEYLVEVDTTAEFTDPVHHIETTDTSVDLTGLRNEQTYFWRVRGLSTGGEEGEWSEIRAFTTIVDLPAPPQLASPEDGSSGVSTDAELVWRTSARADLYEVVISSDSTFGSVAADSVLADTTYTVSGLENNIRYFWRVRGRNDAGAGAWSAVFDFNTIMSAPAVPKQLDPENAARDLPTEVTFRWREATGASDYEFELATTLSFEDPVVSELEIDTTSITVGDLEYDTQYFWRVRAVNTGGRSVFASAFTFFTQIAPPSGAPQPLAPESGAEGLDTTVALTWNAVLASEGYRIQLGTESGFADSLVADSTLEETSVTVDSLRHDTRYFWRVAAVNAGGIGPWSTTLDFTTRVAAPAEVPMAISPADSDTGLARSIHLQWSDVAAADRYELVVARDSSFDETVVSESDLEDTSFPLSDLSYETTYFWRVRGRNDGGDGPWSDALRFTTKVEPSGVASGEEDGVPETFSLHQNYPNPFNPATTFTFDLPTAVGVRLDVMDLTGRAIAIVVDRRLPAGRHDVRWMATGLPSGAYVYRLRAGDFVQARTFVLLK